MNNKELSVAEEYKGFVKTAHDLTDQDKLIPLDKHQTLYDRYQMHLIDMLTMYSARYGNSEERLRIVEFLNKELFGQNPTSTSMCHLTYEIWADLRKMILSNEYTNHTRQEEMSKPRN